MNVNIRSYTEDDLKELLSTWENASKLAHPFLTEAFMDTERENIPNLYLPNAETWVAESEGAVIAFIALIGNEVGALFVQPALHRQGIGRSLMDKGCELHDSLEVDVFVENSIGRAFYTKYGFKDLNQSVHEATGNKLLRMKFIG